MGIYVTSYAECDNSDLSVKHEIVGVFLKKEWAIKDLSDFILKDIETRSDIRKSFGCYSNYKIIDCIVDNFSEDENTVGEWFRDDDTQIVFKKDISDFIHDFISRTLESDSEINLMDDKLCYHVCFKEF